MDFATIGGCGGQKSKCAPKAVSQNNGKQAEQKGLGNLKTERKPLAQWAVKLQPAGSGCWSQRNSCFYAPSIKYPLPGNVRDSVRRFGLS